MNCRVAADDPMVFDRLVFEFEYDRFDYPERRFSTIGLLDERMVVVIWTEADKGRRVISMRKNKQDFAASSLDPADDAPEWTDEMFEVAEFSVGGNVIRPATGYLSPNGVVRGGPPLRDRAKQQVTLRLDPDVIDRFREGRPGWQGRINEALRKAVGL